MPKTITTSKKILVVDDNSFVQYVMKMILNELSCNVKTADNGFDALTQLEKEPFSLVFSDINMPVMNGYELVKTIRASKKPYCDIPVIGVSSCTEEERKKALNAGMNQLFEKPIHPSLIKHIILSLDKPVFPSSKSLLLLYKNLMHLSHLEKES